MRLYVDNDIVHKLAAVGLFDAVLLSLGATRPDVFVVGSARFKFFVAKETAKGVKRYGEETHRKICDIINGVNSLSQEPDVAGLEQLKDVVDIHAGEAVLFAVAAADPDALLLTGDKNALRALAASEATDLLERLRGRVLCFEQLLLRVIESQTFDVVRDAVAPERNVDGATKMIFSNGTMTEEAHAMEGLTSFLGSLRGETGLLLQAEAPPPLSGVD